MKCALVILVAVLCFPCLAIGGSNDLIGKWSLLSGGEGAGDIVEYRQDGSLILTSGTRSAQYTYSITDKNTVRVTTNTGKSTDYTFTLSGNRLTLMPTSGAFAGKPPITYIKASTSLEANRGVGETPSTEQLRLAIENNC